MQSRLLWEGTSSEGANRSWLQKAEGSARLDQKFYPERLQLLERLWLHPSGTRIPDSKGRMETITMASGPLSPTPRCPFGLSQFWHLLLARGLEVKTGQCYASCYWPPCGHLLCSGALGALTLFASLDRQTGWAPQCSWQPY